MDFEYKIGGTIGSESPTYIKRVADENLYTSLLQGDFCYVLTSRQMGKSSLKVRVMEKLRQDGVKCSSIDASFAGDNENVTANQWYRGLINRWVNDLGLKKFVNIKEFWAQHEEFAFSERLDEFVNTILFTHISSPVVIFIDEIDSTIDLDFTDDFFTWIRYCFNVREENSNYKRLTFCFVGVATPTDLIKNQTRTPFNIGKSIKPLRFQENQLNPLMEGLRGQVADLERVQHEIHKWTGGQPFLIQRLCYLIQSELGQIELGQEEELITQLVENKIIENWEYNDEPVHLKTIRDRLLKDEDKAVSLLGLYQQILEGMESKELIEVGDNLSEVMALRLTGLVVSEEGRLFVYNQIYQRVFSEAWVAQELAKLRPYAVSLAQWLANDRDDKYLLTGQGFLDAQQWSLTRQLTREDSQYLAASQKLHTEDVQAKAEKITQREKKKATLFTTIGVSSFVVSMLASWVAWLNFNEVIWRTNMEQANTEALINLPNSSLDRSIAIMKVGRDLQRKVKNIHLNNYPTYSPLKSLRETIGSYWHESNFLPTHPSLVRVDGKMVSEEDFHAVAVSADGQIIVSSENKDKTKIIKVWRRNGSLISIIKAGQAKKIVNSIAVSADGKTIVSTGEYIRDNKDETIKVWRQDGSLITTLRGHQGAIKTVAVSADGQTIISGSTDKIVKVWQRDGLLIATLRGHQDCISGVAVSADGQTIVSGSTDTTVKVWRQDGSLITTLKDGKDIISAVAVSADGQTIVSGSTDSTLRVWQMNNLKYMSFSTDRLGVYSVAVSADGQTIVSTSSDKTAKVWRQDGSLISTLKGSEASGGVGISADGQTIVSKSGDKMVRVWRQDGSTIATLPTNSDSQSIGISADGKTIVTGNSDATFKIWHFDLDYLLAKGCEQLNDYLNSHPEVNREEICPKWGQHGKGNF
jgi:WD40 repeat protein